MTGSQYMYGTVPSAASLAATAYAPAGASAAASATASSAPSNSAADSRRSSNPKSRNRRDVREGDRDPPLPINNGTGALGLPTGVGGFGPTCFFTKDLKQSMVISAYSQFMSASNGNLTERTASTESASSHAVAYGLQGSITAVPAGYSLSFIVSASENGGVNAAFESWGDKLLSTYGKSRQRSYQDHSLNYLGYSTDNGAFYYYQTEGGTPGKYGAGKNYEDTLIDVKQYADKESIPYKYVLLDSWWYYKGKSGGVTEWVGRPVKPFNTVTFDCFNRGAI